MANYHSTDPRILGGIAVIAYGLMMFWLQSTWRAVEEERQARETLNVGIQTTYITKDTFTAIMAARRNEIDSMHDEIKRNADEVNRLENKLEEIQGRLDQIRNRSFLKPEGPK